ncbi:MAG: hypothetical protein K6A69_00065, partial [Lachnospiraceae bacterium]|nr:hypothetical protein [Lachnospiraceae bacterium]
MQKNSWKKTILTGLLIIGSLFVTSCGSQGVTSANQEITEETEKTYSVDITFDGGSGKAYINSPVEVTEKDGKYT